jgi:hypothetical protein
MSGRLEIPFPPPLPEARRAPVEPLWVPVEPRWEYQTIVRQVDTEPLPSEGELNAWGEDHWELVSVLRAEGQVHFYFKRERLR